jgi:hypothetical protein
VTSFSDGRLRGEEWSIRTARTAQDGLAARFPQRGPRAPPGMMTARDGTFRRGKMVDLSAAPPQHAPCELGKRATRGLRRTVLNLAAVLALEGLRGGAGRPRAGMPHDRDDGLQQGYPRVANALFPLTVERRVAQRRLQEQYCMQVVRCGLSLIL